MKDEEIIRGRWPKTVWRRGGAESLGRAAISAGKSAGYTLCGLAVMLGIWAVVSGVSQSLPGPFATLKVLAQMLAEPFYDNGPNDKGIGIQLVSSIGRVFAGFALGSLVAIPVGMLMGANATCQKLFNPLVQLLRPVSPLAWFPIGLAIFKHAGEATIFIIFITSLWPTLINTAFGVASLPDDHRNVARAFAFSRGRYLRRVLIPFALPHILTGLRLSLGIAWVVIVAGEMLSGGVGIGFFVWDSWNALSLERVMSAILLIGLIGLLLDRGFDFIARKVSYAS
ncbi:MAG: nitrate ABC transporter permease [Chloracidobacterium sp.]|nr:nitrate ABC transporter permease [Chloracidobacterium sp.]